MSADPIIYCLERLTDYRQFERLCSALLAGAGYPSIDPLGGTGDEGRDAIIREDSAGRTICFAYTVRSDWKTKLRNDCSRVAEKGHKPDVFVFVCTEALSAADKSSAVASVLQNYGWRLEIYDLERLRVLLSGPQRHLLALHPTIFVPPFFPQRGGESIADSHDIILIDHVRADHALATWLSRRLSLAGFHTWCQGTAPLAGENEDETVRTLIARRAKRYLPILSTSSLSDQLFIERCTVAAATHNEFTLPCRGIVSADWPLPSRLSNLVPADFSQSWRTGLQAVLGSLESSGVMPSIDALRAAKIALGDFLPSKVTIAKSEPVYANVFPMTVPPTMLEIRLPRALTMQERIDLGRTWAFYIANDLHLLAFDLPPPSSGLGNISGKYSETSWADAPLLQGRSTLDAAKYLARRSLEVACEAKKLVYCHDRRGYHFPYEGDKDWNQSITHVDGQKTTVKLTGNRTKGYGERASPFRYQLGPRFHCAPDKEGNWAVVIRLYVRVTTPEGVVFEQKEIGRRRKIVSKSWWNKQWLARLLGVVQALETSDGEVRIGDGERSVAMSTAPMKWDCPIGLDVSSLTEGADIGEEMAMYRSFNDDEAEVDDHGSLAQEPA